MPAVISKEEREKEWTWFEIPFLREPKTFPRRRPLVLGLPPWFALTLIDSGVERD